MKKQTKIKVERNGKSESIPCYLQLSQVYRDPPVTGAWRSRYTINGKRKKFTSSEIEKVDAHRDLNQQCHELLLEGKRKANRSSAPSLTEIAVAYLSATSADLRAGHFTRKVNLSALRAVTRGLAPGADPVILKQPDKSYKLISGGFWDNLRLDKVTKKVAKAFLAKRVEGRVKGKPDWEECARGANDTLRQARGVFTKEALSEVYREVFGRCMPDLHDKEEGFLSARYLGARTKPKWKPIKGRLLDQLMTAIPKLEEEDPDVFLCFLLQYGCGLSWGEVLHAKYDWLDEADAPNTDGTTRYVINVQPTDDWIPKCEDRERDATVPENYFQKILDLRHAPRSQNWREKSRLDHISDDELAKLVWSKSAAKIAEDFGVTSTTIAHCCAKRGIPKPENGFWTKIRLGQVPHPNGEMPQEERSLYLAHTEKPRGPLSEYILQRHRCEGYTSANRRLARWIRKNVSAWDRKQVGHELRKLNISRVISATNSVYEGSKHAGHSDSRVTEEVYGGLLENKRVDIPPVWKE